MNILKINGQALEGIYVDAAISFNKPAKRVSTYSVPGRNGDLVIDEGTFDNVLITYPVFEKNTFPTEFDEIVNYLASLEGYQKIECSNDPQHYRLGRFVVPQNPTAKRLNRDGYYQLSFDCKPQRWLLSGEEDTEIDTNPIDEYSGDIVSFDAVALDEITELKAAIEPVQGLNGYDNPWPAGSGVNKLSLPDGTQTLNGITVKVANGVVTVSGSSSLGSGYDTFHIGRVNSVVVDQTVTISLNKKVANIGFSAGSSNGSLNYTMSQTASTPHTGVFTISGSTPNDFVCNVAAGTVISGSEVFYPQIEIGSSASPWQPYSNICPISGHTEVNVYRTGKNLCPTTNWENGQYLDGVWQIWATRRTSPFIRITPNTDISISVDRDNTASICFINYNYFDENKSWLGNRATNGDVSISGLNSHTLNISNPNACYLRVTVRSNPDGTSLTTLDIPSIKPQVEFGSTATAYEPYAGQTYSISLGQTVYGGTLNVTTGVLTVENALITIDNQAMNNANVDNVIRVRVALPEDSMTWRNQNALSGKLLSNMFVEGSNQISYNGGVCFHYRSTGTHEIVFGFGNSFPGVQSYSEAVAWLMANNPTVLYWLATPITYQLTPTQVSTLLGQNNICADAGEVEVKVTTPTVFNNPSLLNSKPLIRVYGVGTFRVNDITVTIASHDKPYIDIDCELQECYYDTENMNEYVSFSGNDFPELQPGDNYMLLASGITKLDVTPRWWIL